MLIIMQEGNKLIKDVEQKLNLAANSLKDKVTDDKYGIRIDLSFEPSQEECCLLLNNTPLIKRAEICVITGNPGSGKTNCIEALACSHIENKNHVNIDTLGWKFQSDGRKCLVVDTERIKDECSASYRKICNRLQIRENMELVEGQKLKDLTYISFVEIAQLKDREKALEHHLDTEEYELIILDGVLDFTTHLNDERGVPETIRWLKSLASKFDCAVVVTLHPNKGTETMAGHIGSFLYRYCRASLIVRSNQNDKSVKEITVDFPQGKLSHSDISRFEPPYFTWDDEKAMMVTTNAPDKIYSPLYKEAIIRQVMNEYTINGEFYVPAAKLRERYSEMVGVKEETARKHIQTAAADGLLKSTGAAKGTKYSMNETL